MKLSIMWSALFSCGRRDVKNLIVVYHIITGGGFTGHRSSYLNISNVDQVMEEHSADTYTQC